MAGIRALLLFLAVQLSSGQYVPRTQTPRPKMQVMLFYEALCPDCESFIVNQLRPTVYALRDYITVDYVPFGFASTQPDGSIKSQHGPAETLGNLIQVCALNCIPLTEQQKVDYVYMEEQTHAATRGDLSCVAQAGIPVEQVLQMIRNGEGYSLQQRCEKNTKKHNPPQVPYVTIDGVPISEADNNNLMNILRSRINPRGY